MKGLSWADYWMSCGQPDMAHDFGAFSRAEAWALQRFHGAHQSAGEPFGWWLVDNNGIGRLSRTPPQDTIEIYRSTPGYSAIPLYDAQPSPGGQGDIRSEKAATFLRQYLTYLRSSPRQGLRPRWCDVYEALEVAIEALAARQPVNESPMAKMAAALRGKAEAEKAAFDQRVQSGEWGPMPDNPDVLELPPLPAEVDSVVCMIRGEKDMAEPLDYYYTADQMRAYAQAALAARQPVGEPASKSVGIDALVKLLEDEAAECEKAWTERADTYMSGRASGFRLAADYFRKIATNQRWSEFLSSPAQAVPDAVQVIIREYLDAEEAFRAATRNNWGPDKRLNHADPLVIRLREARVALRKMAWDATEAQAEVKP